MYSQISSTVGLPQILTAVELKSSIVYTLTVRYLVDSKWFKQWKKYVGYESWELEKAGMESMNPGPIDNSGLFQGRYNITDMLSFL